jgi:WD40 repeat protein
MGNLNIISLFIIHTMNIKHLLLSMFLFSAWTLHAQNVIWNRKCHPNQRETYAVTFSADGSQILSGSECSQAHLRVFDVASGDLNWEYEVDASTMCLISVKFSSNGNYFGTVEETGKLLVFDNTTGFPALAYNVNIGSGGSYSLDFSSDNTKVAVDGDDGNIRIYDISTSSLLNTLSGHSNAIKSIDWSSNGSFILSASTDSTVRVWDAQTAVVLHEFNNLLKPVISAKVSSDNTRIIVALGDSTIKVFDASTYAELSSFESPNSVLQIDMSYDNAYIAAACDTTTLVFDAVSGTVISNFNITNGGTVYSVGFKPNAYDLVTGTHSGDVVLWSMDDILSVTEKLTEENVQVFPNPASETIQVKGGTSGKLISILDLNGKVLRKENLNHATDIKALDDGVYYLQFEDGQSKKTIRFVKQGL